MTKRILVIDADTLLYSSAAQQQKNECNVIHKASGREKLFESKTLFNAWIKSQEKWGKDEFDCQFITFSLFLLNYFNRILLSSFLFFLTFIFNS